MIIQLKEAITKIEALPDEEQKRIADWINEELKRPDSFIRQEDHLSKLAEEAIKEYQNGIIPSEEI